MKEKTKFRKEILEEKDSSITKKKKKGNICSFVLSMIFTIYILLMVCIATFTLFQPHMRNDLKHYIEKEMEVYRDDKNLYALY